MDTQITPSQRQFADAHKRRMANLWPAQVPKPKLKKPSRAVVRPPKPPGPTVSEWYAMAWVMLENPKSRGSIREIQDMVCLHFNVPFLYMETTRRAMQYYLPRAVAVYLCRKFTGQTNSAICRAFKRDESSIGSCIRSVENFIALCHPITKDIEILSAKLRGTTHD